METFALVLFLLFTSFSIRVSADPNYVSLPSTGGGVVHNRHLLQILTPCSVDFQVQNYTIITSKCKGPDYPEKECCSAFVEFACPFAAELNDNTTNCANTMFSYINVNGHYPAGLFANECVGDAKGLPCPASSKNTTLESGTGTESSNAGFHAFYNHATWWVVTIFSTYALFEWYGAGFIN